jgi:hypothetical protein
MKSIQTTNASRAADQLQLYRKYSDMAHRAYNSQQRVVYQCIAREALRQAAKLDPAAATNASALAMAKVG